MLAPPVDRLIELAITEDLAYGDITSESLFFPDQSAHARIITRQPMVVSGLEVARQVFQKIDPGIICTPLLHDGAAISEHTPLLTIEGPVCSILKGERLALNFLQHLSGIATLTARFTEVLAGTGARITHTRKTIPGLRSLQIQAVVHGGGSRHRSSLSQAVLMKDNHIRACDSIQAAVERLRDSIGHTTRIEVECDTLEQVEEALRAGVELILLDNMDLDTLRAAVQLTQGRAVTEASGGVTLKNVLDIAKTGVNYISTSEITLSAPAVDIGLDFS